MNANEMRQKSVDELLDELQGLLREQFNLRMQKGAGHMERAHNFPRVRRDIARVKTVLNQKKKTESAS
jgi:large subunit ribosomal protein L29